MKFRTFAVKEQRADIIPRRALAGLFFLAFFFGKVQKVNPL